MRTWSPYQNSIFQFVEEAEGNAVVEAVAGAGKSTTIVEALARYLAKNPGRQALFLAFNKAIAEELKRRGVNARTFHSLTYNAVMRFKKARTVDSDKLRKLVDEHCGDGEARMYGAFVCRLVGLARQAGIGCLVNDTEEEWMRLVEHHDLELEAEEASYTHGVALAQKLLGWSNASTMVDFDDLLYIAVKEGLGLPKFDMVFVDEAQDTNAIQRAILRKVMKSDSRLVAVGDPAQAIYGFRGADSDSLNMIADEFACTRLPLTVSYRCPQAVVRYAGQWVNHIEPAPNAPEGLVTNLGTQWDAKTFRAEDLVVCRTTQPLIALGYQLLKQRVAVRIMGREIGQGLKALIEKMRASGIERLQEKLLSYTQREVEKAIAKRQEAKAAALQDKTDCVLCLIDGLPETERTVPALLRVIDTLFSDVRNAVVLGTIHKAKGLESRRVFWLNSSGCPSKWAKQEWQQAQERNLCYVATTRAQEELVLIEQLKTR